MRSLLTMLGIIIGIAAVIAIVTVGNSMTGTVTDSMSGMGVSNITLSLSQKSSEDTSGTAQGVTLRRFMDSTPGADDLITDEMLDEFTAAFPNEVSRIDLSQEVGSGTIEKYGDPETTITATVSGSNAAALQAMEDDTPDPGGRWLDDERTPGGRWPWCRKSSWNRPSRLSNLEAVGKSFTLNINGFLYTFYINGVYEYTENVYASMFA